MVTHGSYPQLKKKNEDNITDKKCSDHTYREIFAQNLFNDEKQNSITQRRNA